MKLRLLPISLPIVLLFLTIPTFADMTVIYAEGLNESEYDGNRHVIQIGDVLPSAARVFVESGGYIELDGGDRVVRLHNPGVYVIETLEKSTSRVRSVRSGIPDRLSTLVVSSGGTQTSASGIRARTANPGPSTGSTPLSEGLGHLNSGRLDDAEAAFLAGYAENADPSLAPAYEYFIAWIEYQRGNTEKALAWVQSSTPDDESPYLIELNLLHARLLLESFDPVGAVVLLHRFSEEFPEEGSDPEILLLMGIAYANAGEAQRATEVLSEIADEPQLTQAQSLLSELGK